MMKNRHENQLKSSSNPSLRGAKNQAHGRNVFITYMDVPLRYDMQLNITRKMISKFIIISDGNDMLNNIKSFLLPYHISKEMDSRKMTTR